MGDEVVEITVLRRELHPLDEPVDRLDTACARLN